MPSVPWSIYLIFQGQHFLGSVETLLGSSVEVQLSAILLWNRAASGITMAELTLSMEEGMTVYWMRFLRE